MFLLLTIALRQLIRENGDKEATKNSKNLRFYIQLVRHFEFYTPLTMLSADIRWLIAVAVRNALRARMFVVCHAFDSFKNYRSEPVIRRRDTQGFCTNVK